MARPPSSPVGSPSRSAGLGIRGRLARTAAGCATALVGGLSLGSAITPNVPWRENVLVTIEPGTARGLGHVLAAAGGLALVALGWGVVRGRRRAARAASIVLLALAAVHLAKGLDYEEAAVALALAVMLQVSSRAFVRGGEPRGGLIAVIVMIGAVAAAYTLDTVTLLVTDRARGLGSALDKSATALGHGAWWLRSGEPVAIALDVLVLVGLVALAALLRGLLRPAESRHGHSCEDHMRAAEIVARHGHDSLDPFALREDKAFHFSNGAFLAYRTLRETAVVSGDPIGPPEAVGPLVADFLHYAAERGWDAVITAVSPRFLDEYRALGLRTICVGQEAVVRPAGFSLEGRAIRKVRQSVARVERRGWTVEVVDRLEAGDELCSALGEVERDWRAGKARLHGFAMSLGRLWGAPEDSHAVYAVARDEERRVRAFIRFARYARGLSLDAMRRTDGTPNGMNEALVVATLRWAKEAGLEEVSLNFAGFAHVMASGAGLTRGQRTLRWLLKRAHGRFQLERLVHFNNKFAPTWRPRYLVYGVRTQLPLAALRVLQAESYIRPPRGRSLQSRWQPFPDPVDPGVQVPQLESIQ